MGENDQVSLSLGQHAVSMAQLPDLSRPHRFGVFLLLAAAILLGVVIVLPTVAPLFLFTVLIVVLLVLMRLAALLLLTVFHSFKIISPDVLIAQVKPKPGSNKVLSLQPLTVRNTRLRSHQVQTAGRHH